jgi:ribosomal-protein-alanine N-acetyltransferase
MAAPVFRSMTESDLDQILPIERDSFPAPWTRENFLHELRRNPHAWNVVVCEGVEIVGYAAMWILEDELHINEIAVRADRRRQGTGTRLMERILKEAVERGCRWASLEVRPSNVAARKLYENLGFRVAGHRHAYYRDTGEDGLVLKKPI